MLISGLMSHSILFKDEVKDELYFDVSLSLFIVVVMGALYLKYAEKAIYLFLPIVVFVFKDCLLLFGKKRTRYIDGAFQILIASLAMGLNTCMMIDGDAGSCFILTALISIMLFPYFFYSSNKAVHYVAWRFKSALNLIKSILAESFPFLSGYFLLIESKEVLNNKDFLDWRQILALLGLSSLIGSAALILFSRGFLLDQKKSYLLMIASIVVFCAGIIQKDVNSLLVLSALIVFTISSIFHNLNKAKLPRGKYLMATSLGPTLVIFFHLFALKNNTLIQANTITYVKLVIFTQFSHILISYFYLMKENIWGDKV